MRTVVSAAFIAIFALTATPAPAAEKPGITFIRTFDVVGKFAGKKSGKAAKDVSGMACTGLPARHCLLVNDENQTAQFAEIGNGKIKALRSLTLIGAERTEKMAVGKAIENPGCRGGGKDFADLDGEAVAYSDGYFYVAGSHGCTRGSAAFRPSVFILVRIPVNKSGQVIGKDGKPVSGDDADSSIEATYRLGDIIPRARTAGEFFGKALNDDDKGLNIEGLAVIGDRLYAGLRAPSKSGSAFILVSSVAELFAAGKAPANNAPDVFELSLGTNAGIRDMAPLSNGRLLLLSGPSEEQHGVPYRLFTIDPKTGGGLSDVGEIPTVPNRKEADGRAKAESVTVLSERANTARVLILFDGLKNGGPREYEIRLE